jgi:membrane associated rhomboid family serine protease
MVKNILIANIGIFVLQALLNLPLSYLFGLWVIFSDQFAIYQFLTYMWIHGGFGHLLGNMFAVFIFGPLLEQVFGAKRFLIFYLVCGIGAGILFGAVDFAQTLPLKNAVESYTSNPTPEAFERIVVDNKNRFNINAVADFIDRYYANPDNASLKERSIQEVQGLYQNNLNIPMVGASGAVFGILMAFGLLFPNMTLMLLIPPIPVKAKYLVLFYGLYELYAEFSRTPGDNIAHLAHLGGMLIAFILIRIWQKNGTIPNRLY